MPDARDRRDALGKERGGRLKAARYRGARPWPRAANPVIGRCGATTWSSSARRAGARCSRRARDLAADPLVARWVDKGWPLVGRRAMPGEAHGVALGLPLPPFAGKRRLSLLMQADDIISTSPPPAC